MSNIAHIQVSVGQLPEWYNESKHDPCLEQAIENNWQPHYDGSIEIVYNYQSVNAIVTSYDDDGNVLFERNDHDLAYAFEYARNFC